MGARQQGRETIRRAIQVIDELTLILGSVEMDPIANLRALVDPLQRLSACIGLFEVTAGSTAQEIRPLQSIRQQLGPVIMMVIEPNVIAPPFSPDLRQRVSYGTAQLVAMRLRLDKRSTKIPGKVVRREADALQVAMTDSWKTFRTDPSLEHLAKLEADSCYLSHLYFALGLSKSEPRVKGTRKLCALLNQASDRNGELDDVPALLRQVTERANEISRPTLAEHRAWIESLQ